MVLVDSNPSLSNVLPLPTEASRGVRVAGEFARWVVRTWGPLMLLWSIPGLVSTTQTYFLYQMKDPNFAFKTAFMFQFSAWQVWALATPAVLAMGRRFRLEAGSWGWSVAVHLLFNTLLGLAYISVV